MAADNPLYYIPVSPVNTTCVCEFPFNITRWFNPCRAIYLVKLRTRY